VRYEAIEAEKARYPVAMMCELLEVSASGFYAWQSRPESGRKQRDRELVALVQATFAESRWTYGSPRITAELRSLGERVARKRVARLMREQGIEARRRRRFVQTTNSDHDWPIAGNALNRDFSVGGEQRVWAADITYIATTEGWLYLAVVLDLRSRAVVGWAMEETLEASLALKALEMSIQRRGEPALHHSDRGVQYACDRYQAALEKHGIACSMSRTGNCWDNAVVESFFSTLKTECIGEQVYASRVEAKTAIFDYIECFYNRRRRHSSLGYRSPAEYEREVMKAA
jgi:putative transposase